MNETQLSNQCPYCETIMQVSSMRCDACDVTIGGHFPPTRLGNLPVEHQRFIELFVLAGGSLKEISKQAGVSYPTVRSRLDKVMAALRDELDKGEKDSPKPKRTTKTRQVDVAEMIKQI